MIDVTYTPAEAAEILRCSPDHVRALIASGQIQAADIGTGGNRRRWRITPDAIMAFLRRRERPVMPKRASLASCPIPAKRWI